MNYPGIQGLNPNSVNLDSVPYSMQQYNPQPQQQPQQSWLKSLLQFAVPVAGSIGGGLIGGPVGMVAGGGGASALLNYLGGGRQGQDPMGAAEQDAMASLLGLGIGKVAGPFVGKLGQKIFPQMATGAEQAAGEALGQPASSFESLTAPGGALNKLFGASNPEGGLLNKVGTNIRGGVFTPKVPTGAMQAPETANLKNISDYVFGFKGSPGAISKQAGELASPGGLPSLVQQELAQNNNPVTKSALKQIFNQNIDSAGQGVYSTASDKVFAKSLNTQLDNLLQNKDVAGIYAFKSKLPVSKIFDKLAKGGTLTQNESAILVAHQTAADAIDQFGSPAIRTLNKLQQSLNPIAEGAQKAAQTPGTGLQLVGTKIPVPSGQLKTGQDFMGRTLQDLGTAGQTPLGRAAAPLGTAIGAGVGNMGSSAPQQTPPEGSNPQTYFAQKLGIPPEQVSPDGQWIQQNGQWTPNQAYAGSAFHQAELGQTAPVTGGQPTGQTGGQVQDSLTNATIDGQPISPGMADLIRKVANYEMDLTKVTSLRTDQRQKLAEYVSQYDPTFDMTQYAARAAIRKDFTSGKSAASIRSLNTAIGHLKSLQDAGQQLGNTGIPLLNTIKNTAAQQAGQAAPVKFNNAANAVAGEMSTVFKGISGTDQEIKSWREQMNSAQSPAQIQAGIDQMIELMGSRLQAFDAQWNSGINKPKDFAFLSPNSRKILTGLGVDVNSLDPLSQFNPNQ